jgi:hypothetical protein
LPRASSNSSKETGTDDMSNLLSVIGVTSISLSARLISFKKLEAINLMINKFIEIRP